MKAELTVSPLKYLVDCIMVLTLICMIIIVHVSITNAIG
jgi:hypothetical protein